MSDHLWALFAPIGLLLLNALIRSGHQLTRSLPNDVQVLESLEGATRDDFAREVDRKARLAIAYSRFPVFVATDPFIMLAFCAWPLWSSYEALKGLTMDEVYIDPATANMSTFVLAFLMPIWLAFFNGWELRANGRADYIREHVSADSDYRYDHLLTMRILLSALKFLGFAVLATAVLCNGFYVEHMIDLVDGDWKERNLDYVSFGGGAIGTLIFYWRFSRTKELNGKLPTLSAIMSGMHPGEHPREERLTARLERRRSRNPASVTRNTEESERDDSAA